jgi:lactoylglutathione lyase
MAKINHIALKVQDLDVATRFYENVYGFSVVGEGNANGHISRHMTDGYIDLALMLYESEQSTDALLSGTGACIHHFGVEVEDRAGTLKKITDNGGVILSDPTKGVVKYRAPDGTIAELVAVGRYENMKHA